MHRLLRPSGTVFFTALALCIPERAPAVDGVIEINQAKAIAGGLTWSKHFDGSTSDPTNWPAADLVALPEPSNPLSLVVPGALVALLARRSRRDR